jgi:hypothetical protein
MKPKLILCLALALSGGLFGCSTAHRPIATFTPESKFAAHDWRPMLRTPYWHDMAMKLKQSRVPTEVEAMILASHSLPEPTDSTELYDVTALLRLSSNDPELGNEGDFIWEVREIDDREGEETSALAWVDAFTGKVKVLYPKPDSQIWEYQSVQRTDYPGINKNADFPWGQDSGYGVSWENTKNVLEQQGWHVDTVTISETILGYPPQPIQMATIVLKRVT